MDKIQYILLKTVNNKKEISYLEQVGYSYPEIATCLSDMISEGLLDVDEENDYILSDAGYAKMSEMEDEFLQKGYVLIEPLAKYRIDKISKYDIFIE